ncbi:MAG: flagellar biosynthesis anti-sigma factor FlgM [Deltaproteobacteria bacterium]|jgi:negative regulator of flagellin synthesis FlgM|nr:flagellar biosynthesis anti-sigma factor FlgM [Deltaproteobacteria bacterium]
MKIDPTNSQPLVKKTDSNSARPNLGQLTIDSAESSASPVSDRVNISTNSRLYQRAMELAAMAPDIRSEKVADLTARIAAGTYKVSSETVADAIIRKSISEFV